MRKNPERGNIQGPLLVTILGLFSASVYFYYQGQSNLAFYLLGCAIFISIFMSLIFLFSIDSIQDDFEKKALNKLDTNHQELMDILAAIRDSSAK